MRTGEGRGAAAGSCILHYIFMGNELIAEHDAEHTDLWGSKMHVCVSVLNFYKDRDTFKRVKEWKERSGNWQTLIFCIMKMKRSQYI